MRFFVVVLTCSLPVLCSADVTASPDEWGSLILPIPQLSKTPTIDGKIDSWIENEAFRSDKNSMFLLWTLKPADNGTTVFCGKTNGKLYVAVRCEYPKSSPPVCRETKRDNGSITRDDCIELFLAGENTDGQKDIFHWIVNSGGTFFDECNRKVDWNGKVVPRACLTKDYWDVEFLIDPATLGLKRDGELRLNVNRHDNAPIPSQLSSFLPNNTTTFHVPYDVLVKMEDAPIPAKLTMSEKFLAGGAGRNGFHSGITFNDKLGPVEVTSVVFRASDGKLLDKKQGNNVQGRIGFDHEIIEVADYVQQVTLSKNGKVLAKLTKPIQIQPDIDLGDTEEKDLSKKYEWVDNKLGIDDTVPAPWTPVEFSKDKIFVLGREYLLGKDSFFQQIIADKQPLLATPINLFMKSAGKTVLPVWSEAKVIHKGPDKVVLSREVKWGDIASGVVKFTCEFDGFAWCEMDISTQGKVDAFWCTIPITLQVGKYFDIQQLEPNQKIDLAFSAYHWFGNEDVGLRVCPGESDEFWSLKNLRQACRVLCSEKQTEMRLNFITTPPAKRQLKYAWGLQATPTKPVPQNVDLMSTVCVRDPQTAQNLLHDYVGQPEKFTEWLSSQGVKTLIVFQYFQKYHGGHIPALDPKITKDLVRDAEKAGIRCILYRSREFGEKDPLWKDWAKSSLRKPTNYGFRQTWPIQQTCYVYCPNSKLADYMVWSCKKLMEEYGFKGMYYDVTVGVGACMNPAHGCGYVDEKSGLRRPTYPILALRKMMKRLYKVIKKQSPDAVIDAHCPPGPCPAVPFLDSIYWGEQFYNFERFDKDPLKIIPLDQFRAEFLGKAKGLTTCFLCYPGHPFSPDEANAIAFIHGVTARPHNMRNPQSRIHLLKTAPIWKALKDFQIEKAKFHPYWEKGRTIHYGAIPKIAKNIYISYYQRENETLYLASNFDIHTGVIYLRDDQWGKNIRAVDALTGEPLVANKGQLSFFLEPYKLRVIKVTGE